MASFVAGVCGVGMEVFSMLSICRARRGMLKCARGSKRITREEEPGRGMLGLECVGRRACAIRRWRRDDLPALKG